MQYDPNLREKKEQERKIEPIVQNNADLMKKGVKEKFTDTFLAEDIKSVMTHVCTDVVIPQTKDLMYTFFTGIVSRLLFGSDVKPKSSGGIGVRPTDYTSYDSYFGKNKTSNYVEAGTSDPFHNAMFKDRGDAEKVLDVLRGEIAENGFVTVATFYGYSGVPIDNNYMANRWGWTTGDLDGVRTVILSNGKYSINLPKAKPIKYSLY